MELLEATVRVFRALFFITLWAACFVAVMLMTLPLVPRVIAVTLIVLACWKQHGPKEGK